MNRLCGRVQEKSKSSAAASEDRDWSGFQVSVHYGTEFEGERRLVEKRFPIKDGGRYTISLSDTAISDESARVSYLSPAGESLASFPLSELRISRGLRNITLPRPTPDFKPSEIILAARESQRLTGRIMIVSGASSSAANLPLALKTKQKNKDSEVVWAGTTDRLGYFRADIRNEPIESATLLAGAGDGAQSHAIRLSADGRIPSPLIVAVESIKAVEECDCDVKPPLQPDAESLATEGPVFSQDLGTSCQSMTVPNRTLEEFDFFQIVRTTDPEIRGTTMSGGRPTIISREDMGKIVFDAGTLAQRTGASNVAVKDAYRTTSADFSANDGSAGSRQPTFMAAEAMMRRIDPGRIRADGINALLREQISVEPLSVGGVGTSALWRLAASEKVALDALDKTASTIPAAVLSAALEDPDGFTPDKMMTLERRVSAEALRNYLSARSKSAAGRGPLNEDNRIDWDHTPEFYQATSVAHGHILHFKQEWKADGYSLGDLLKSIPLAPGQQKQIVTLDWDRDDRASRTEQTVATETLFADLSRDRDINEIANARFRENLSGSSSASTGAVGGGFGLAIGPLVIGGGGGSGWASSNASQNSARNFSAQSLNQLNDQTSQSVAAVRNQRSTVVDTVSQSETVSAITEIIANYNRCHALTIQYFEVLRHFAVQERLAGVKECLFVPLDMSLFDDAKILRWREILENATPRSSIRRGYDAVERLSSPATTPPNRRFADDPIEGMSGRLRFRVTVARPKDPDEASQAVLEQTDWGILGLIIRISPETIYQQYSRNDAQKDRIFQREIAPMVAREFLESLQVVLIDRDGQEHPADFDITVGSRYQENGIMDVVLNDNSVADRLPRAEIAGVEIRTPYELPEFSRVVLESARIVYRTERISARLVSRSRVLDDVTVGDPAFLDTSDMTWFEERNQLTEARRLRRRLIRHLNDNIEYYHRSIWLGMDPNRRYMLLDGFEAPNANGRSLASVVENRLIGVVGNCLVMPVAPGFQLDPVLREVLKEDDVSSDVLTRLYDLPLSPPRRHSVPTRGVFGEAMPGTCNSCEVIEEDRFWRWSDYPLPDSPPSIAALSTDSRFAVQGSLAPTVFPDSLIKYQTVPDAPAPTGLAAAIDVLSKDVFKDLTGLTMNQKNALAALTSSMATAQSFAGEAVNLAIARDKAGSLDRTLGQIEQAKTSGYLDDDEASKAARDAIIQSFGGKKTPTSKPVTQSKPVAESVIQAATSSGGKGTIVRQTGEEIETIKFEVGKPDLSVGKAPVIEWIDHPMFVSMPLVIDEMAPAGAHLTHSSTDFEKIDDARDEGSGRGFLNAAGDFVTFNSFGWAVGIDSAVEVDFIQSALDSGLLKPNPADATKFQVKIEARLGYPAKSGSKTTPKAVHFPHSGKRKMPLLVILHGNAAAWLPTGTATAVTLPNGTSAFKGALTSVPNHEGYKYLQDHLAKQPEPVITLSISSNIANATGSLIDMRARIVNEAIKELKAEIAADPSHFLKDAIDFYNVGLMGHSRGGEAVIRAHELNLASPEYKAKAVLSLAPTDFTGNTSASRVSVDNLDTSYLMIWGGLDGDVSGLRVAGDRAFTGAGTRIYDRTKTHKALVFAPACTHNRFNNPVWRDQTEWQKKVGGAPVLNLPANVASEARHEALIKEFASAFFDLTLNGNAAQQLLFRGEVATTSGLDLMQQWDFGSGKLLVDDFENATANFGTRTLGTDMSIEDFTAIKVPAGAAAGSRDLHVNHNTKACILDVAAAALAPSTLSYDLTTAPGVGVDISAYQYLTIRLAQLRDPTDQTSLNHLGEPDFTVRLFDGGPDTFEQASGPIYSSWKNKLGKPLFKEIIDGGAKNATQMVLHTFAIEPANLSVSTADQTLLLTRSDVRKLEIEFSTGAGTGEIWIDSIQFIQK